MVEAPKPSPPARPDGVEAAERIEPKEGVVIGGWTLRRLLGKGGMGQVWKVDRPTAAGPAELAVMKLPLSNAVADHSTLRRAGLEAKAMYLLQGCPNIVQIKDVDVHRGVLLYVVMEYVHGADLGEVIRVLRRRREKLAPETAAWIAGEIGAGLKAIHNLVVAGVPQNLRHLDIALKNILVSTGGQVKIGDFGLASGIGDPDLTNRGSYKYMAPEHYFGVPSQKSDIFALGVVLWELLERDHYRFGTDAAELRAEITAGKVREVRRTDVSPQLAGLVHDCLSHNEAARPSIDQFMVRLERVPEYRMQRTTVAELIARCFERLRTSGHTEVIMQTIPAVTADIAGLMAASEVLIASGTTLELSEVFRGVPKPKSAPGYVSPTGGAAEAMDGPAPPGMFGAPEESDDARVEPVVAPVAPAPRFDPPRLTPPVAMPMPMATPTPVVPRRTLPLDVEGDGLAAFDPTTRLPDGVDARVMGPSPDGGIEIHRPATPRHVPSELDPVIAVPAAAAVATAPAVAVAPAVVAAPVITVPDVTVPVDAPPAFDAHGEPPWPLLPDQRGDTGPRPEPVLPTDRLTGEELDGPPRPWRRRILLGAAAVSATLVLGTVAALSLAAWIGDGNGPAGSHAAATKRAAEVRASQSGGRLEAPVPQSSERASGPTLRPIESGVAIVPTQVNAESTDAVESAGGDGMPTPIVAPPVPAAEPSAAPEPSALPPAAPEPADTRASPGAGVPATSELPPVASTAKPKPKPKPAPVVMVPVEVRNSLIKPGIEVMIGKKKVTTTGSSRFEIAAGRHRVKWREAGTTAWIDAGKFDLAIKRSHLFVIGKISYPHGVRHVPQEIR